MEEAVVDVKKLHYDHNNEDNDDEDDIADNDDDKTFT